MASEHARQRDAAARHTLDRHYRDGLPFVLMLRNYGQIQIVHNVHIQHNVFEQLAPDFGVLSIRGLHDRADLEEGANAVQVSNKCPAFLVSDDEWFALATELIQRAAFIVAEVYTTSAGLSEELAKIFECGRKDQTIVILPPPKIFGAMINAERLRDIWRVIITDDFRHYSIYDHPVAYDLFQQVIAWKNADDKSSVVVGAPPTHQTLALMLRALVQLARFYEASGDMNAASLHAQTAWNCGRELARANAPFARVTCVDYVVAGLILVKRLVELEDPQSAWNYIYGAELLASSMGLEELMPDIMRNKAVVERMAVQF